MLTTEQITVLSVDDIGVDVQQVRGVDCGGVEHRALNYVTLTGRIAVGHSALVNTTAVRLGLGTGGFDFVISHSAPGTPNSEPGTLSQGHIIKARYLPCQVAVDTVEEHPEHEAIWDRELDGMPVLAGQLHSQVIPAAYGLRDRDASCVTGPEFPARRIAYIMSDAAALPLAFSNTVRIARRRGLIDATITYGQAFGGDYKCVTLQSALLAAKHLAGCHAAIVCQGPGNAGTGTRYGYSGIEQAGILDTVARLGGTPVAIVRMSDGDPRGRHQGVSHHTRTTLKLAYARCLVPLPANEDGLPRGGDVDAIADRHDIRLCDTARAATERFAAEGWGVTTMGRGPETDRLFFEAAIAAGIVAGSL